MRNFKIHIITLAIILTSASALSAESINYIFFAETPEEITYSQLFLQCAADSDTDSAVQSNDFAISEHMDNSLCSPAGAETTHIETDPVG